MLLRLSSKGQLVLPKAIRQELRLKHGDQFRAKVVDGKIVLEPVQKDAIQRLYGILEGADLLKDLEEEHRQEVERENQLFT